MFQFFTHTDTPKQAPITIRKIMKLFFELTKPSHSLITDQNVLKTILFFPSDPPCFIQFSHTLTHPNTRYLQLEELSTWLSQITVFEYNFRILKFQFFQFSILKNSRVLWKLIF